MEIYTNSVTAERSIFIPFPIEGGFTPEIDVSAYIDGTKVHEFTTVLASNNDDGFSVTLPLSMVQHDSHIDIHWKIEYVEDGEPVTINRKTSVDVTTPILTRREIRDVWDNATPAEVIMIEKAVRHVIQAYTGQEFGHFIGTVEAMGSGSEALFLPRRAIEIESLDGIKNNGQYEINSGGWMLKNYAWGVPPVKADYHGLHIHTGGVIHNPNNIKMGAFRNSKTFKVKGRWGWEEVPAAVKEAAKLLVNDYACADSQYRDRYLVSMTAADWRIQFNSGAYLRTGNVRADQLLADYVITRGWGVI